MKLGIRSGKQQVALASLLFACCSTAVAQRSSQHAKLSLISEQTSLSPGSSGWIGLRFQLEPGWHIYWTNPGDSGEPPKVVWHLPPGMEAGHLQFPAPQRIKDHSLMDYGYENDVVLLSRLTVTSRATSNTTEISTDVRYLVCREVCVPAKEHLSLDLPVGTNVSSSADAKLIENAREHLPQSLPPDVRASAVSNADTFVVRVVGRNPNLGSLTDFIPADEQIIDNATPPEIKRGAQVITLKKSEQLDHPVNQLYGLLITRERAYAVKIPVVNAGKATSRKTISQKHQVSNKSQGVNHEAH